jgi:hypothetical protein
MINPTRRRTTRRVLFPIWTTLLAHWDRSTIRSCCLRYNQSSTGRILIRRSGRVSVIAYPPLFLWSTCFSWIVLYGKAQMGEVLDHPNRKKVWPGSGGVYSGEGLHRDLLPVDGLREVILRSCTWKVAFSANCLSEAGLPGKLPILVITVSGTEYAWSCRASVKVTKL